MVVWFILGIIGIILLEVLEYCLATDNNKSKKDLSLAEFILYFLMGAITLAWSIYIWCSYFKETDE